MPGLLRQIALGIRLNFRNRMALIYGYLFPTIFLAVAGWGALILLLNLSLPTLWPRWSAGRPDSGSP